MGLLSAALLVSAAPAFADMTSQAKRTENKDGSTSMVFSNEVADLGAKVGVNVTEPASDDLADPVAGQESASGSAFAKVTVKSLPSWMIWQKGVVDVTADPADESGKVATTLSRTVEIQKDLKATVSDSYTFERDLASQTWQTDKSVSLDMVNTGTTLSVGAKATQDEERWLPSLSASQKIFGDLKVTTSVADTGSDLNKSVTAGFSHKW